jgi:hypothetical protein
MIFSFIFCGFTWNFLGSKEGKEWPFEGIFNPSSDTGKDLPAQKHRYTLFGFSSKKGPLISGGGVPDLMYGGAP